MSKRLVERPRNENWKLWRNDEGFTPDQVTQALLMDIRDELQGLNTLLHCQNFTRIPHTLADIKKNTKRPVRKVNKAK